MSDEPAECPLCMEVLELDDHGFFPCTCGYQICRFCWHRIRTDENGLCPACRKQYPEDPAEFKPLTEDELQNIRRERKQKDVQRKQKAAENRKHLANVRVVQKNLVFVVGLSPRLADPDVLKKNEYFGKFGKIHKVVINQSTSYAGSQGPSASAYVTYVKPEDALRAILTVNNVHVDGRTLKTSLGTTKYCSHFLKGSLCQKNDCMYLHELGQEAASFTKDEMQAGKHQEYEQRLVEQFLNSQNSTDNHHVITNNKLKKNISQQVVEKTDVIPSLMDMAGDIKQGAVHPHPGPLLPNPGSTGGTGGVASSNGISSLSSSHNSAWPLLERSHSPGHGRNKDKDNNNKTSSSSSSSSSSNSDPPVINSSNHTQNGKSSHRSNTPPGSGGGSSNGSSKDPPLASSNPVGTGRQKPTSSTSNSVDDNLTSSQASSLSSSNLSSSPDQLDSVELLQQELNNSSGHTAATNNSKNSTARGLPLPTPTASSQTPSSPRAGGGGRDSTSPVALIASTMNGLPTQQPPMPQDPQQLVTDTNNMGSSSTSSSSSSSPSNSLVSAIGSSRTLMTDPPSLSSTANINSPPGLSFFSNNSNNGLLGSSSAGVKRDATLNPTPDLPNLSLSSTSQELSDSLPPISSDTDWSAAFGFKSNKDFSVDDDLGFDPCAESFKGLADLIEKETSSTSSSMLLPMENGLGLMGLGVSMQQHQQQLHHHHSQHNNLHSPQQNGGSLVNGGSPPTNGFLPPPPQLSGSPLSHQQQTSMSSASHHLPQQQQQSSAAANPAMSRLPPGFSMSHIQQQQQMQHLYRPDLAHSKMLDYLNPQFGAAGGASHHQRFSTLHGYHSMPLDLHTQHQQQQQTPSHQLQQRDGYNMKDMQEQLRSLLPNINISFGASPQQQSQQQQQQQTQQLSSSLQLPQQQSQVLNKSWPLSSSPDTSSPWNDPAIVSTSQLPDHAEHAPHWLKSLQQLTETDGPSSSSSSSHTASSTGSRLPFVQQFPMAGTGGWPTHTLNPPPGFRMNGMSGQPNTESAHQMAEGVF